MPCMRELRCGHSYEIAARNAEGMKTHATGVRRYRNAFRRRGREAKYPTLPEPQISIGRTVQFVASIETQ